MNTNAAPPRHPCRMIFRPFQARQSMNSSSRVVLPCVTLVVALVLGFGLSGCSKEAEPPAATAVGPATPAPPEAMTPAPEAAPVETPAEIAKRADAAVDAQRLFAPPGDNAFELYLRVIEAEPDQLLARNALTDLFPYAVMHVEQRLSAGDPGDAERVLGMMEKANPQAPALPRLRTDVTEARTRSAAAETADAERAERATQAAQLAAQQAAQQAAQPTPTVPAPAARTTPGASTTSPPAETAPPIATPPPAEPAPAKPTRAPGTLPGVLSQAQPRYPSLAQRRGVEGSVEVQFTVLADGSVTDVSVVRSEPSSIFDREAISAMQRWRFKPTPGADPVRGRRIFDFKLAN